MHVSVLRSSLWISVCPLKIALYVILLSRVSSERTLAAFKKIPSPLSPVLLLLSICNSRKKKKLLFLHPHPCCLSARGTFQPLLVKSSQLISPLIHSLVFIHLSPLSAGLVSVPPAEKPVSPSVSWTVLVCCLAALCAGHTQLYGAGPARRQRSRSGWWKDGERWSWLSSLMIGWEGQETIKRREEKAVFNFSSIIFEWV